MNEKREATRADETYHYKMMASPVGQLTLVATAKGLAAVLWAEDKPKRVPLGPLVKSETHPVLLKTEQQLRDYFDGTRQTFSVTLDPRGTPFQNEVWAALQTIPFGETRSYGEIAAQIGNVKAQRAVGAATGRNPLAIVVPCHRVIGTAGALTGFAGGLAVKEQLLAIEGNHAGRGLNKDCRRDSYATLNY